MATASQLAKFIARKKALGLNVSKEEVSALTQEGLQATARANVENEIRNRDFQLQEQSLEQQRIQGDRAFNLGQQQLSRQKRADTISGIGQLGFLGFAGLGGKTGTESVTNLQKLRLLLGGK